MICGFGVGAIGRENSPSRVEQRGHTSMPGSQTPPQPSHRCAWAGSKGQRGSWVIGSATMFILNYFSRVFNDFRNLLKISTFALLLGSSPQSILAL